MAVLIDNAARLLQQIAVNLLSTTQTNAVIGPRGSLGLQVDAHLVGSGKGSLGRTIAVEAHVIQPVLLTLTEDGQPRVHVGRRIARFREAAVLDRTTQEERTAVEHELAPLDADVAQADVGLVEIVASLNGETIEIRMELVPNRQVEVVTAVVLTREYELQASVLGIFGTADGVADNGTLPGALQCRQLHLHLIVPKR